MNKKGFTLIELLAVILILGIIALIAIPSVTNIIKESKRSAFKASVENVVRVVEQDCQLSQLRGEQSDKTYTFKDGESDIPLNVKGALPKEGTIIVDCDCNVQVDVTDGGFKAKKSLDSDKIEVKEFAYACKRATDLHEETCTYTSTDNKGCYETGYATGDMIEYGRLGNQGEDMVSGDAFDCDVNGDGTYDSETERFYYVSDYYDTTKNEFDSKKATLIYYNNTTLGIEDNTSASLIAYNSDNKNYLGPTTAIVNLPKRTQWKNSDLITGTRAIVGKGGKTSTGGGVLPTAYDYSNYAARLLTIQELEESCQLKNKNESIGELDRCKFLMENTNYSSVSSNIKGYWLESPYYDNGSYVLGVFSSSIRNRNSQSANDNNKFGVRPAITVLKDNISY